MAPSDHQVTLQWLVDKTGTVFSHPLFYDRLNEVINHPRSSVADIAKIITEDQGLTARILRLANSPMFGCFAKVDSISRAVTIIGTQQLRDLALAASVMKLFKGIPEELISMPQFWRHSIACGIVARNIGVYLRENNVERLFVSGILHDVGQLIMLTAIPEKTRQVLELNRQRQELYQTTEQQSFGFTHADVASELLKSWKIPANISEPVFRHHHPGKAEQFPLEAAIIHFADIVCQAFEFGANGEWSVSPLDDAAWQRIRLPLTAIATIITQSEPVIEETFAILAEE